ncbi:MAG: amidohydrolase family protein [Candidatus Altiarchaeales archaeon]|nr:amidohydrolase family protein [Candidatus Altiarchaeales archaeon]
MINSSFLLGDGFELLEEGHLVVEKGRIKEVNDGFITRGTDAKDLLCIPALINAHTHIGDSFAKEAALGLPAGEAMGQNGLKWSLYQKAKKDEILRAMRDSVQYMLNSGISCFADFREGGVNGADLLRKATEGIPIKPIVLGRDDGIENFDGLGLNPWQLGQIPSQRNKPVAVHAGESKGEVAEVLSRNPDIIVHFTLATREDIATAARKKVSVVLCPRANALLGVGIPPVRELMERGINVALGTDNVMLNSPSLWREMEFISKLSYLKKGIMPADVLRMATSNAAKAFGLNSGTIKKGKEADLIFLDRNAPNLRENKNLLAAIVHRTEPENVRKVMVSGEFVVEK